MLFFPSQTPPLIRPFSSSLPLPTHQQQQQQSRTTVSISSFLMKFSQTDTRRRRQRLRPDRSFNPPPPRLLRLLPGRSLVAARLRAALPVIATSGRGEAVKLLARSRKRRSRRTFVSSADRGRTVLQDRGGRRTLNGSGRGHDVLDIIWVGTGGYCLYYLLVSEIKMRCANLRILSSNYRPTVCFLPPRCRRRGGSPSAGRHCHRRNHLSCRCRDENNWKTRVVVVTCHSARLCLHLLRRVFIASSFTTSCISVITASCDSTDSISVTIRRSVSRGDDFNAPRRNKIAFNCFDVFATWRQYISNDDSGGASWRFTAAAETQTARSSFDAKECALP